MRHITSCFIPRCKLIAYQMCQIIFLLLLLTSFTLVILMTDLIGVEVSLKVLQVARLYLHLVLRQSGLRQVPLLSHLLVSLEIVRQLIVYSLTPPLMRQHLQLKSRLVALRRNIPINIDIDLAQWLWKLISFFRRTVPRQVFLFWWSLHFHSGTFHTGHT